MYKFRQYEMNTNKNMNNDETRIITLSDLNWNKDITRYEINDLIVSINDLHAKYLFILGNITNYNNLQDLLFQKKLKYFFDLLSTFTKTYLVFGKKDYEIKDNEDNKKYVSIDNLISIYKQFNVNYLDNSYLEDTDTNIFGLNLDPNKHYNFEDKKNKIKELMERLSNVINNQNFNILCTHADISALKNDLELLKYFNLIVSKGNYNIPKPSIFHKNKIENKDEIFNKFIIENKGLYNKEEMDLIKIMKI